MENLNLTKTVLVFGVGVVLGGGVTYLLTNAKLKTKYAAIADEEIASVKEHYKVIRKPSIQEVLDAASYDKVIGDNGYSSNDEVLPVPVTKAELAAALEHNDIVEPVTGPPEEVIEEGPAEELLRNIFEEATDVEDAIDEDDEEDEALIELMSVDDKADDKAPYMISFDTFLDDEPSYDKITISYFEADDVLCDDRQGVIEKDQIPNVIGFDCLSNFGYESPDKHIVHVRNDFMQVDYEVVREEGAYAEQVLGVKNWDAANVGPKFRQKMQRDDD